MTALLSHNSLVSQVDHEWPSPPGDDAHIGIAGEITAAIDSHTESDPIAVLVNMLVFFGNAVGVGPHFMVGATRHHAREFATLVGQTSKARKGDSIQPIRALFEWADPDWCTRIAGGLSTGEGLIHAVRDPIEKKEAIKEKGRVTGYQMVLVDGGVEDKRLLVIEPELAKVTAVTQRQGNSLSPTLRAAWDTGSLRVMTRANPLTATGAHVSMIAHITIDELLRELSDTSAANGFANRFLWFAVRRSKLLPEPEPFTGQIVQRFAASISRSLAAARTVGQMVRDTQAAELWREVYPDLSAERDGLAGSLTARAEAHVLRLSMIYALLDGSSVIRLEHLTAALELWGYSERSVEHIFAGVLGDPVADAILKALRAAEAMTRTEISGLFGRHESGARVSIALQSLQAQGLAEMGTEDTGGRPRELWRSIP